MNNYLVIGLSAVIGLGLAFAAWARPHGMHPPISIEQAENRAAEAFAAADANGDTELSRDEFAAAELPHPGPRPGRPFAHRRMHDDAGPDSDAYDAELFDALDADGDGMLSRAEAGREQRHAAHKALIKQRMFTHLDSDNSGAISASEFTQRVQRLRELDENADGEISRDEFRSRMRARHHSG